MARKLTLAQCRKYAPLLRKMVEAFDTKPRPAATFYSGICMASELASGDPAMYSLCTQALQEIQKGFVGGFLDDAMYGNNAYLRPWEQRAWMCLLMAHWLEDRIKAGR